MVPWQTDKTSITANQTFTKVTSSNAESLTLGKRRPTQAKKPHPMKQANRTKQEDARALALEKSYKQVPEQAFRVPRWMDKAYSLVGDRD